MSRTRIMIFPIGCADFEDIREDQYYYVDKTALIKKLIDEGCWYFLSRPRRFGKSLLVSTLECLFEGKKELFKGLYIEDKWDWSQKYPVVRLSMTGQNHNPEKISENIINQITIIAESAELDLSEILDESALLALRNLLFSSKEKTGNKAVVLVDEYDAP
ncbi:MAG: AAA family ATPase, partial [Proteobacteria bacterium]|nr:AAA family ATPase [Pseudomonadota bacterium]